MLKATHTTHCRIACKAVAILLAMALLWACTADNDAEDESAKRDLRVAFTMQITQASPRNASESWGNYAPSTTGSATENAINPNTLKIMICNAEGQVMAQVEQIEMTKKSDTEYAITGTWMNAADKLSLAKKIMVVANSQEAIANGNLQALAFNRTDTQNYLPMWGVATLPNLVTGKSNNIGNISMLRAVAKVQVSLRNDMAKKGFSIASLAVNRYNAKGYVVPDTYNKVAQTTDIGFEGSLHAYDASATDTPLYFTDEQQIYLPEYTNVGATAPATISVELNRNGQHEGNYTLYFRTYDSEGAPTGAPYNIQRNHYYLYTIYKAGDQLIVTLHVKPWNVRQHDDIIM